MAKRKNISTWTEYNSISDKPKERKKQIHQLITMLLTELTLGNKSFNIQEYVIQKSIDLAALDNGQLIALYHEINNDGRDDTSNLFGDIWEELDYRDIDPGL